MNLYRTAEEMHDLLSYLDGAGQTLKQYFYFRRRFEALDTLLMKEQHAATIRPNPCDER